MNLVWPFHTNIDLTWELSGSLRQLSACLKSDAVEFALKLPSTCSYSMTAIQAEICPSSPAELDSERGNLMFWWLTVEGAMAFGLFSVSWRCNVFGEVGLCIFCAPECFMIGWPVAYAFSFQLPSFIELWQDPVRTSAFIIIVSLWLLGLWCFGWLGCRWLEVMFVASLLGWLSWLLSLLMWLLLLGLFAVWLDFSIGGSVKKLFHAVKFSILWGQRHDLGLLSWS